MAYEIVDGAVMLPAPAPEMLDTLHTQIVALAPSSTANGKQPGVAIGQLRDVANLPRIELYNHLQALVATGRIVEKRKNTGSAVLVYYLPAQQ
jgi:hypothetical protein